ncbi:MAG: hypothetical protein JWO80_3287 [Bryobacterales bacterium]|nr:hypothetical protein [Bryobacterales bacterium]
MIWAWERPEDLTFINPKNVGVAFLAATIGMHDRRFRSVPRLQPLRFPPRTALMAVVRLESAGSGLPDQSVVIGEILRASRLSGVRALQVDFDARQSERAWYVSLLRELQAKLRIPLTMTALASWCEADDWIRDLPVAEAVPMLFRMGAGRWDGGDFSVPLCRSSLGVSTDELPATTPRGRRIYFFHPSHWTPEAYQGIIGEARRRQ